MQYISLDVLGVVFCPRHTRQSRPCRSRDTSTHQLLQVMLDHWHVGRRCIRIGCSGALNARGCTARAVDLWRIIFYIVAREAKRKWCRSHLLKVEFKSGGDRAIIVDWFRFP